MGTKYKAPASGKSRIVKGDRVRVIRGNHRDQEGKILRSVLWHSLALAALVALIVMAYAFLFPGLIPSPDFRLLG